MSAYGGSGDDFHSSHCICSSHSEREQGGLGHNLARLLMTPIPADLLLTGDDEYTIANRLTANGRADYCSRTR